MSEMIVNGGRTLLFKHEKGVRGAGREWGKVITLLREKAKKKSLFFLKMRGLKA